MIELEFTVAPQVMCGRGAFGDGHPVDVTITESPTVFPDHEAFVAITLSQGKAILANEPRVLRTERAIDNWLDTHGHAVGAQLDRAAERRRKALGR